MKVVPETEFRIYLELFEEIALMQAGLRSIVEAKDTEEAERVRNEVRERQAVIDRIHRVNRECLDTRQTIQEFA